MISQDPVGGDVRWTTGTAVNLVVSLGPVQATVPDVVGLSQAAAEAAIVAANLTVVHGDARQNQRHGAGG